ncbi:MAG: YfhO family protein, partial [Cyclobacteriaceae bacterium]
LSAVMDASKFELPEVSASSMGTVEVLSRKPNEIIYKAGITGGDALAVFSEIYYDNGWTASVNGKEADILRANYVLRALALSEGNHEIKFTFAPKSYFVGNTIMLICGILVLVMFFIAIFLSGKTQHHD